MYWDLALILSIGVCAVLAVEGLGKPGLRSTSVLAGSAAAWGVGELLLQRAIGDHETLVARRVLFAGIAVLGPCLLWTAARLHGSGVRKAGYAIASLVVVAEVPLYAALYGSDPELFISGSGTAPVRGPLFFIHGLSQWLCLSIGMLLFGLSAARVRGTSRVSGWIIFTGICFPLALNWLYVGFDIAPRDPTPVALVTAAVAIRWGVLDMVGAPFLASLARSELLDQLDAGILVADVRGLTLEMNQTARALVGPEDPIGADVDRLLAPFEQHPGFDVRRLPLERHGLRVGEGIIVTDRRQERAAELRADIATRLEALGLLSQGLGHEINNPLTAVIGSTELLAEAVEQTVREPDRRTGMLDLLDTITSGSQRISSIVRRLSRLASLPQDESDVGIADVSAVAKRAAELARFGKSSRRVQMLLPDQPVHAAIRAEELLQIFLHLVSNALDSDEGSALPVEIAVQQDDVEVAIEVRDRGAGFPGLDPSRIFEPFFTTKRPDRGVGLGLSLCWEIARQNGGRLEAFNRDGGGARLRLTLLRSDPSLF